MTEEAGLISIVEGLVVDVAHFGSEYPDQRFYVGLEDPNAALLAVSRALKIGRGDSIQASRRLSKRHGRLLMLRPGRGAVHLTAGVAALATKCSCGLQAAQLTLAP